MSSEPTDESEARLTYGGGLAIGALVAGILTGSWVYWRRQSRKGPCGCAQRPAQADPTRTAPVPTNRYGHPATGYVFLPEACVARPPRALDVMRQLREFAPPNTLYGPQPVPAGTALTVVGVFTAIRDEQGRARCDVTREGVAELLGAFLSADDFPPGPCRDAYAAALAGSPAPPTTP